MTRLLAVAIIVAATACNKSPEKAAPPPAPAPAPVAAPEPPTKPDPAPAPPPPPVHDPADDALAAASKVVAVVGAAVIENYESCHDGPAAVDKAAATVKPEIELLAQGWKDPAIAARLKHLLNDDSTPTGAANAKALGKAMHCDEIEKHYLAALGTKS